VAVPTLGRALGGNGLGGLQVVVTSLGLISEDVSIVFAMVSRDKRHVQEPS
jgi:hypothetical protein